MKRAIGVAALGGGLLAFGAGTASAQEVSTDISARVGRTTAAEVRVCADGRVVSRLVGSCSGPAGSRRTTVTVQAGRGSGFNGASGIGVRARAPRLASADVSVGTRRSRPSATGSGQASVTTRPARADATAAADTGLTASADATASLSRPLLDLGPVASLAGVSLLGSSPFTLVGDPAADSLLPTGELTLADLTGEAPAGIGVLESGPIASGNQVGVDVGDVSPSVPVTICGTGVGVLGDASATCGTRPAPATGGGSAGTGGTGSLLDGFASGNQVDAGIGNISPSVPVTVCGNGAGVLGDASAGCGASQPAAGGGTGSTGGTGGSGGGSTPSDGLGSGTEVGTDGVSASGPVTVCGDGVGLLGDTSLSCGSDTSTGGIIAPPPATTPPGQSDTGTSGIRGTPGGGGAGTSGLLNAGGLTPGTGGGAGDPINSFALLGSSAADGSGALPFTGAAGDLLAVAGAALLGTGFLAVRATRPDTATKGGGDR